MTLDDCKGLLRNLPARFELSLLKVISAGGGTYCVAPGGYCERIMAADFDAIVRDWYKNQCPKTVKSMDAIYMSRGVVYLIEFKTSNAPMDEMYRKIYDSVIALVDKGGWTYAECQRKIVAILVQKNAKSRSYYAGVEDEENDFRTLAGYLVRECLYFDLDDFDKYAECRGWK